MKENSIGKKLRDRRIELSLTQRDVANHVGVTEATVSRWESGEIDNMRRDKIASLAKVLQVSPLLIMGADDCDYSVNSSEEIKLLDGYRNLDSSGKQLVASMVERLNFNFQPTVMRMTAI